MGIFRDKTPPSRDVFTVLLVAAFPVFIWSIVSLLRELPAFILRLSLGDLIGVISYTLAFALFESGLVTGSLVLLALVLPGKFYRVKFVAISTTLILISSVGLILAQFNTDIIRVWGMRQFLLFGVIFLIFMAVPIFFILRFQRLEKWINNIVDRMQILSLIYVFFGVVSAMIIIIRNI